MSLALATKGILIATLHISATTCRLYEKAEEGFTGPNAFQNYYGVFTGGSHAKNVDLGWGHQFHFQVLRTKGHDWLLVKSFQNAWEMNVLEVRGATTSVGFNDVSRGGFELAKLRGRWLLMAEASRDYMPRPPRQDIYYASTPRGSKWEAFGWYRKVGKSWRFLGKP